MALPEDVVTLYNDAGNTEVKTTLAEINEYNALERMPYSLKIGKLQPAPLLFGFAMWSQGTTRKIVKEIE